MRAFQFVQAQQPPELREVPVPEPGPGQVLVKVGGAGACHSDLHLMEAPAERLPELPLHARPRERGVGGEAGAGRNRLRARGPRDGLRPLGLRNVRELPGGHGELLRDHGRPRRRAWPGHDGGMAPYLLVPATRFLIPLGSLDPREAAPLSRRGADQLSRRQAVAASAGAGLDRGGDRGGRPRPDGHPDSARAQLVHHRRRRGHRGRQARDRRAHGRGRGAAVRRRGGHPHQGHDTRTGRPARPGHGRRWTRLSGWLRRWPGYVAT